MGKTAAVTLPPGEESEKDLIFEAADGDNADTILTPIRFFVYPIETNETRFFRRMARNFSGDWRKNNPTNGEKFLRRMARNFSGDWRAIVGMFAVVKKSSRLRSNPYFSSCLDCCTSSASPARMIASTCAGSSASSWRDISLVSIGGCTSTSICCPLVTAP